MRYTVAEETAVGYLSHIFETCDEFQAWARQNPRHGSIVSRALAGLTGRPLIGTIDHRLDKPRQAEAQSQPVENMRLF